MDKAARYLPSPSLSFLLFESIDQFDSGEEPGPFFVMLDGLHTEGCGNVALSGPRRTRGILPNITPPKGGSFIGITLATVRASRS